MPYVEFLRTTRDGKQEVAGRAVFDGSGVTFEGLDPGWVEELQQEGIRVPGGRLYPAQGMEFLRGLRIQYSGSYMRATEVKG